MPAKLVKTVCRQSEDIGDGRVAGVRLIKDSDVIERTDLLQINLHVRVEIGDAFGGGVVIVHPLLFYLNRNFCAARPVGVSGST